jgi:hypothetical protein
VLITAVGLAQVRVCEDVMVRVGAVVLEATPSVAVVEQPLEPLVAVTV